MEELLSPRSALEAFVRPRTPQWLSQTLKINLQTVSLEDLFANCWILGRVADTAEGLLNNVSYKCPPPELGNRPYRDVISDIERFHAVCDKLSIDADSRITLADVEQRKAGTRVALCLWDISDALRARGYTSAIPEFAPANDYAQLRKAMPREISRMAVEKYENGGVTPGPAAPRPRPTIPLLPLDTSPALQKYRARAAVSEEEKKKMKKAAAEKAAAAAEKSAPASSSSAVPVPEAEALPNNAASTTTSTAPVVKEPPPSLSKWLPDSSSSNQKAGEEIKSKNRDDNFDRTGSPTVLSTSSLTSTPNIITSTSTPSAPRPSTPGLAPSCDEEYNEAAAGGVDILASILSPDKNKPAHTQVINALMRSAPGPTPAEEATSAASAPRSKRSLTGFIENTQVVMTSSRQTSARNSGGRGHNTSNTTGHNSDKYVKSFTDASGSEPWWKVPLVGVVGAAVAVIVMNIVGGGGKDSREKGNGSYTGGKRGRGGVQHAGRW